MKKTTLKYIISLAEGIAPTSLRVHTTTVEAAELEGSRNPINKNLIEGDIEVELLFNSATVSLIVVGDAFKSGSFNLIGTNGRVFDEDMIFTTGGTGRAVLTVNDVRL